MSSKVYLDDIRMSLNKFKTGVCEKFSRFSPTELAIYYIAGTTDSDKIDKNPGIRGSHPLRYLIDFYVETRSSEFQEEFRSHLEIFARPDEGGEVGQLNLDPPMKHNLPPRPGYNENRFLWD